MVMENYHQNNSTILLWRSAWASLIDLLRYELGTY